MNVHLWSEHIAEGPGRRAEQSRLNLVQQAENLALASIDKRLNIAALSRMLVVSERTLRKAFRVTYGLSPCRHLRMLRLLQVRQVLMSSHNRAVTVTEAATCFGFVELGRFANSQGDPFDTYRELWLDKTHHSFLLYPNIHLQAGSQGHIAWRAANAFLRNAACLA